MTTPMLPAARVRDADACFGVCRRTWRCVCVPVLLAVCRSAGGADAAFDRHDFVVGDARETVLAGSFLPGASAAERMRGAFADIAIVGGRAQQADGSNAVRLRFLRLTAGGWTLALEARLGPRTLFVDKANIAGRERVVAYQHGRLTWFDPETGEQRLVAAVETRYRGEGGRQRIARLAAMRDLDSDGRDDLLLADVDGFWVAMQAVDGTFGKPAKFGPPDPYLDATAVGETRSYGEQGITAGNLPWYLGRVYQADFNHDGRRDLAFWNEDRFDVHYQNEAGEFHLDPASVRVDVPFDADGAYSLMFEYTDENLLGLLFGLRKKTRLTTLHTLGDMNGDGVADLVTHALEGRRLGNHRSTYRVYFGAATLGATAFAPVADAWIRPRGTAGALQAGGYSQATIRDFDGDGWADFLFADVVVGFGGMVRAIAGRSVAINVELHRLARDDEARRPVARLRLRPRLYPTGEGVFFPPVLFGDVHGDGHPDLVVGQSREELRIFAGERTGWANEPQRVAVPLPDDERNTSLMDLSGDGKQDILIYDTSRTPHRLTTLIAR